MPIKLQGVETVGFCNHLFMQLLTRPDTYYLMFAIWRDRSSDIGDSVAGDFRYEQLAAPHVFDSEEDKLDTFLKGNIKAGHALIRDGEDTAVAPFL